MMKIQRMFFKNLECTYSIKNMIFNKNSIKTKILSDFIKLLRVSFKLNPRLSSLKTLYHLTLKIIVSRYFYLDSSDKEI